MELNSDQQHKYQTQFVDDQQPVVVVTETPGKVTHESLLIPLKYSVTLVSGFLVYNILDAAIFLLSKQLTSWALFLMSLIWRASSALSTLIFPLHCFLSGVLSTYINI